MHSRGNIKPLYGKRPQLGCYLSLELQKRRLRQLVENTFFPHPISDRTSKIHRH
jgi:hypothetical protein